MGRIAAAIWAAIGAFGYAATLDPVQSGDEQVQAMRVIAITAVVIAGAVLVIPWPRLPKASFNALLVLMSLCIGALAFAGGSARGDLTMLFTFVVVFAAYFLSWRVAVAYLVGIAVIAGARLAGVEGGETMRVEVIRLVLLLPALVIVAGLVSMLRGRVDDREARLRLQEMHDPMSGLLSSQGLGSVLDSELSRAARHARPLSVVVLEVTGSAFEGIDEQASFRLTTTVARSLLTRIRAEDWAARLRDRRFAVIASETAGDGTAVVARGLVDQVRKRLVTLGYDSGGFSIAVGWADYPRNGDSSPQLLATAEKALGELEEAQDGLPPETGRDPGPSRKPTPRDAEYGGSLTGV